MENEALFSQAGFYHFIVTTNALTHHHAIRYGEEIVARRLVPLRTDRAVRVLDLACGGEPITISQIMAHFSEIQFEYVGIDINPDQVKLANTQFRFSDNVVDKKFIEANAWQLTGVIEGEYDIVFSGLNFHHAIPEELYALGIQLRGILSNDGFLLNHDLYRPDEYLYLRRPDVNPANPRESFRLIEPRMLSTYSIPDFGFKETDQDWRNDWFNRYHAHFAELGADNVGIQQNRRHMLERDFPVSTSELQVVLQQAGFQVECRDLRETNHPIGRYVAMVTATRDGGGGV